MCTGDPWECCPRAALKSILATAQREHGLTFRIGYESEFILLHKPGPGDTQLPPPFDTSVYCQTSAFDAAAPGTSCPSLSQQQHALCIIEELPSAKHTSSLTFHIQADSWTLSALCSHTHMIMSHIVALATV